MDRHFRITVEDGVRLAVQTREASSTFAATIERPHPTSPKRWQRVTTVQNDDSPEAAARDAVMALQLQGGADGLHDHVQQLIREAGR